MGATLSRDLEARPKGIQVREDEGWTLPEMREMEYLKQGGNLEENAKEVRVRWGD